MQPPAGQTCGQYLGVYASAAMGTIYNPNATSDCQYCSITNSDQYLSSVDISFSTRWRNFGIGFSFILFNIFVAVLFYYLFRVRKSSGRSFGDKLAPVLGLFKKDPLKENNGEEKEAPQDPAEPILPK
jgi:ABC-type multidrug transport system permease subunit